MGKQTNQVTGATNKRLSPSQTLVYRSNVCAQVKRLSPADQTFGLRYSDSTLILNYFPTRRPRTPSSSYLRSRVFGIRKVLAK